MTAVLQTLFRSEAFWTMTAVFFGFCLGEGWRWMRDRPSLRRKKSLILEELSAIASVIPLKINVIDQMIAALQNGRYLPGTTVRAMNQAYQSHLAEVSSSLTRIQRNCLHVIYESLRIADYELEAFERNYLDSKVNGAVANTTTAFVTRLRNLRDVYSRTTELVAGYIRGSPPDVFPDGNSPS